MSLSVIAQFSKPKMTCILLSISLSLSLSINLSFYISISLFSLLPFSPPSSLYLSCPNPFSSSPPPLLFLHLRVFCVFYLDNLIINSEKLKHLYFCTPSELNLHLLGILFWFYSGLNRFFFLV